MATVTFITDDFSGTAGAALESYSASWVKHPSSVGTVKIAAGSGYMAAQNPESNQGVYRHTATPPQADYSVTGTIIRNNNATAYGGVCIRMSSTSNTFYTARYATLEAQLQLYKFVNGTATLLGAQSATLTMGVPTVLRIEAIGSAIKVYENGSATPSISVTDTAITAAGFAGLRLNGSIMDVDLLTASYESSGSTTQVSNDLTAGYSVRSSVQGDSASEYSVRAAVQADASSAYTVLGAVSADLAAEYKTLTSAQADLAASFTVRGSVQADAASSFTVRGSTQADAPATYLLRGSVSSDAQATYDILNANSVSSSLAASYVVLGAVQSDMSGPYDLRTSVGAASEHAFMVRGLVSSDLASSYEVQAAANPVYADLAGSYAVDGIAPDFTRSIYWAAVPAEKFSAAVASKTFTAYVPSEKFSAAVPGGNQ